MGQVNIQMLSYGFQTRGPPDATVAYHSGMYPTAISPGASPRSHIYSIVERGHYIFAIISLRTPCLKK